MQRKTKNPNVSTAAMLIAKEPKTGATRKVGSILWDAASESEFILLDSAVDYSLFKDDRFVGNFIKIQILDVVKGGQYD